MNGYIFLLIIFIWNGHGPTITMHEFPSYESCMNAKGVVSDMFNREKYLYGLMELDSICIQK